MFEHHKGQVIETESGGKAVVIGVIGKGRQSTIYLVDYKGEKMALKWYDSKVNNLYRIRSNIKRNIADGKPDNNFLWCRYMTKVDRQTGSFGYLMELIPDGFERLSDIVRGYRIVNDTVTGRVMEKKVRFSSLYTMITAVMNIVNAFRQINKSGKSFQGLDDGSFFINTHTGDILVSDCDTIASHGTELDIHIRPAYKAPEVISGSIPNEISDTYSLAIILFRLLFRGDAFEGEKVVMDVCLNESEIAKHYGSEAVFVYSPDDTSNRPVRGIHDNVIKFWKEYPEYIKEAFIRTFTVGISNPEKRVSFGEWQNIFIRLRSEILSCVCGKSHFISIIGSPDDKTFICPECRTEFATIKFSNRIFRMPLCIGSRIFMCETDPLTDDYMSIAGEIVENKLRKGLIGIKNCSGKKWSVRMPDGMFHDVLSGKGFPVWNGLEIDFGKVQAKF